MSDIPAHVSDDLREHYSEIMDELEEYGAVIISNQDRGDIFLISAEDYRRYEEFTHNHYVIAELKKAKKKSENPNTKWYTDEEVGNILDER